LGTSPEQRERKVIISSDGSLRDYYCYKNKAGLERGAHMMGCSSFIAFTMWKDSKLIRCPHPKGKEVQVKESYDKSVESGGRNRRWVTAFR
jgi:hypothetical protein